MWRTETIGVLSQPTCARPGAIIAKGDDLDPAHDCQGKCAPAKHTAYLFEEVSLAGKVNRDHKHKHPVGIMDDEIDSS